MKRKRGYVKSKPKNTSVVGANEAFQNVGWSNANHNSLDDFDNAEFDSRIETETPQAGSNMRRREAGLVKQVGIERTEDNENSLRKMNIDVSDNLFKKSGTVATKSSRGFGSSRINLISSKAALAKGERTHQEEPKLPHQDLQYKEQELNDALVVIKKIMKMDAAAPFNIPVNPIALGIPDYFEIVDTPMDFGTIYNNLEKGLKYMNSEDVFKDVQYIWENCSKYNKKGDYILELMKRVKTNFMKYWAEAGLYKEQPQAINGNFHLPHPTESSMRRNKRGQENQVTPVSNNPSYPHLDQMGLSPVQSDQSSSNFSEADKPRPSSNQQQLSPQEADLNICTADSAITKRRGRGPTRCLKVWNTEGRISIATNELGQPIGLEAPKLANFLGTLARDGHMAPLTYVDWRAMPESNKENMWQQVELKFDIDPQSKSWVLDSLGKKWRNWKCMLKAAHYNSHATDEERLADRDERVLSDQWSHLIAYWNSNEGEKRSATNKAIRAQQKFSHTTGTKSFARLREEEKAKRSDGKEPTWAELFILTRTRKDGQPVNEASSAIITQLRECEPPKQLETSQSKRPQDEILSQVMGKGRYDLMLTYGIDPSASGLEVQKPTRAEAIKMVSKANAEVHEMKERMVAMEQTCAQMAAQMATMMSMMSSMHRPVPDKNLPAVVAESSHVPEGLPLQQAHSSTIHHVLPSRETRAMKRGKTQNASTSKVNPRIK